MFYVITIDERSVPGKLFGPMAWDACVDKIVEMANLEGRGPLTADELNAIDVCGSFESDSDGVYAIQAE